jgi:hypothetical protein
VRGGRVLEAWWELPLLLDSVALIIHDLVALIGNFIIVKKILAFERGANGVGLEDGEIRHQESGWKKIPYAPVHALSAPARHVALRTGRNSCFNARVATRFENSIGTEKIFGSSDTSFYKIQ